MRAGIVGAGLDLGADRRGVDMGPSAIRYAGLEIVLREAGHTVRDFGDTPAPVRESTDSAQPDLKYLRPIIGVCTQLAERVDAMLADGWFPVVLGGDHSVSLGSVSAVTRSKAIGLVWMDAHGDFNTPETSPSGNIHGMVLSALTGYGEQRLIDFDRRGRKIDPSNAAAIGVRDLDPGERALLRESGVQVFTMHDVDRKGLPSVIQDAIDGFSSRIEGMHLSLDLDVVDPLQAPGVGTPVLGGLTYRETHLAMELIAESGLLSSMDVVEVNPVLDTHNKTARQAAAFISSALGKRIY
jgi:arginase